MIQLKLKNYFVQAGIRVCFRFHSSILTPAAAAIDLFGIHRSYGILFVHLWHSHARTFARTHLNDVNISSCHKMFSTPFPLKIVSINQFCLFFYLVAWLFSIFFPFLFFYLFFWIHVINLISLDFAFVSLIIFHIFCSVCNVYW